MSKPRLYDRVSVWQHRRIWWRLRFRSLRMFLFGTYNQLMEAAEADPIVQRCKAVRRRMMEQAYGIEEERDKRAERLRIRMLRDACKGQ